MSATSAAISTGRSNPIQAIFWGGLIAGILDILYAFAISYYRGGRSPIFVLQSVAGGALGRDATFSGGIKTAALGLVCHFIVATCAATAYVAVSRVLRFMVSQAVVCGLLYGAIVFGFMNWVVLPISAYHSKLPQFSGRLVMDIIFMMILVGLPIGLMTRRFAR